MTSLTKNPKPPIFFSLRTQSLTTFFEGSNSSFTQLVEELWCCKVKASQVAHVGLNTLAAGVQLYHTWKLGKNQGYLVVLPTA